MFNWKYIQLSNQSFSRTTITGGYTYVYTIYKYVYIYMRSKLIFFPSPISSLDCLRPKGKHLQCKQLHYAWSQQIPLSQEKSICYILSTWLTSVHHRLNFDPLKLMANVKKPNNSYSRWLVSTQAKKHMLVKLDHFPRGRKYLKMFETTTWETIRQPLPGSLTKKGTSHCE